MTAVIVTSIVGGAAGGALVLSPVWIAWLVARPRRRYRPRQS